MNNDLDSFTVERLEEITELKALSFPPSHAESAALARIALAAKRAEPWGYEVFGKLFNSLFAAGNYASEMRCDMLALYTTPRLNSPEVSDGWKGTLETAAKLIDLCRTYTILGDTGSYKERTINDCELTMQEIESYLAAAPEKP